MQLDTGDVSGALQSFNSSLEWAKRGSAQFPSDETLATLAMNYGHLGETLGALGDLPGAIENYRQAAAIAESLLEKQPNNAQVRRGLRGSYSWIGSLLGNPNYVNLGDLAGAEEYSRKALTLAAELAAQDSDNMQLQADLQQNLYTLAEALLQSGDRDGARSAYHQSLDVAERAAAASPRDLNARLRLIQACEGLGRCFATLGADRNIPRGEQLSHRRAACDWPRKALDLWIDWSNRVAASNFGAGRRDRAARAVAGCD
jgi:tetratricopeptide (TPR) repeat protein